MRVSYRLDTEVSQEKVVQGTAAVGQVLRELARQKESEIEEGHLLIDHVHILISIPPKYAVSQVVGFIKGKSAIWIARHYGGRKRISAANIFGHVGTTYQPLVEMKKRSGNTSRDRKQKTNVRIN